MFIKSIATAMLAVSFAGAAMAEDQFNATAFLAWNAKQQESYVTASLAMAAAIAPSQSSCINAWNQTARAAGYKDLIATMQKYSSHHPTAVVLALIERDCGRITIAQH